MNPAEPSLDPKIWNQSALLSRAEMTQAEALTTAGGPTFPLMQRAGEAFASIVRTHYPKSRTLVLCGPGNNGGDGFIAAEALRRSGWDVRCAAVRLPTELAGDAAEAAHGFAGTTIPLLDVDFTDTDLVIDALFGIGLSRPLDGAPKAALEKLAKTKIPVVALDIPSGVDADTGAILGGAPKAALTVTFFRKKPGHVLHPGAEACGEVVVADIGIKDAVLEAIKPATTQNTKALWQAMIPFPKPDGHKYSRGHVLIYGGAVMTGASRLAARAAQRIGAGLVTLGCPPAAVALYAAALESVIVRPVEYVEMWKDLLKDPKRNAVLVGPGMGLGSLEDTIVMAALETKKPCVLDADALGNFADKRGEFFPKLHAKCVLTPHEGEFTRLFRGHIASNKDKLTRAREAAKITNCPILLKGPDTVIAHPDGRAIVSNNAPPWLATAGAGDVLGGIILGLIAQEMPSYPAAAAAAWIHGQVAATFGPGLIAEDLVSGIPAVLRELLPAHLANQSWGLAS
jgi:hydroxyethylthiazole kinase-like uncharacterized protein yjeF